MGSGHIQKAKRMPLDVKSVQRQFLIDFKDNPKQILHYGVSSHLPHWWSSCHWRFGIFS
jgi:hypothetical protein